MQRLGRVLHITPSRKAIIRTQNIPRIGGSVVDEDLRPVGKIFDIFGPVSSPYVAIRPMTQNLEELTNKTLYVLPSKGRKEKL